MTDHESSKMNSQSQLVDSAGRWDFSSDEEDPVYTSKRSDLTDVYQ